MASRTVNTPAATSTAAGNVDDEDLVSIDDVEQLCSRMAKYEPCFRLSLIQHHLKRLGISCNDERFVKLLSLSFETMVRSMIGDCARVNRENNTSSKTLTSELLAQALLLDNDNNTDNNNRHATNNSQQSANSTLDVNDFFD